MDCCPQGHARSRAYVGSYGYHVCEGGCHFVYDRDLNAYMGSNEFEQDGQQIEGTDRLK